MNSHGRHAKMTKNREVLQSMQDSVKILQKRLQQGEVVYGVNTGFGGSADTRTREYAALQKALIQMQTSCVLLPQDRTLSLEPQLARGPNLCRSHSMPIPVVRAAMLTRCNSLLRGHSAVRPQVVEYMLTLLRNGMTPVVPLRGSISASGDLAPLSYIAGAIEGNCDISVHVLQKNQIMRIIPADEALRELGLEPLDLGPKEGLGLLNGTAFSSAASSLVLFEANQLILLSQLLTAMATEALAGHAHSHHPFIAAARPHRGQIEAAANIFHFLRDSHLAVHSNEVETGGDIDLDALHTADHHGLSQDRYALRTATQWMGPQLESMVLALEQVTTELNSTTDNPLVNLADGEIYHGGNFQAASITSAMEKTASALQMTGKMIFAQSSEVLNPALSRGLPPNLSIDDPSLSYAFKGIDINMAAYVSELGYLNHPVSNHVQSAEMHNQGLNSLAFIACRYATESVEVLSLMVATYLYILCQALDIRVLQVEFNAQVRPQIDAITAELFPAGHASLSRVQSVVWDDLMYHWSRNSTSDLQERAAAASNCATGTVLDVLPPTTSSHLSQDQRVRQWKNQVATTLQQTYDTLRAEYVSKSQSGVLGDLPTVKYLCRTSRILYLFVREELGVPLHRGYEDHPTANRGESGRGKLTIGSQVSKIYTALREGRFGQVLLDCC